MAIFMAISERYHFGTPLRDPKTKLYFMTNGQKHPILTPKMVKNYQKKPELPYLCYIILLSWMRVHFSIVCMPFYDWLERALRALASSSRGAAFPGGTRGQPRGWTPGVRGWFQGDLSEKKILWRTDGMTEWRKDGRTDVSVEIVI